MSLSAALAALQSTAHDFNWFGDQARTILMTVMTGAVSFCARMLWSLRDDMRDVKRDLHGTDGQNGIKSDVKLLVKRVDAIEDRNIAIDAVSEAERHLWPHPDRRQGPRRLHDVVRDAFDERMHQTTDEHQAHPPEDDPR